MAQLTLILGGVRSGKSRFAEQLAAVWPPVTYLATAQAGDVEMGQRIGRHRQRRPASWETVEEGWDVPAVLAGQVALARPGAPGCILLDCLPLWLTNLLMGGPEHAGQTDQEILAAVAALLSVVASGSRQVFVVSSEVGCGLLPANALARRFGDLLGEANQFVAAAAHEVFGVLAGISVRLK